MMGWITGFFIDKLAEVPTPVWHRKFCLRVTTHREDCLRCQQACPTGALKERGKVLQVQEEKCRSCGACVRVCPSQALGLPRAPIEQMLQQVQELDEPVLTCDDHPREGHARLGCLLGVHRELLILLSLTAGEKPLVLNLSHCAVCPQHCLEASFQEHWRQAEVLVQSLNLPFSLVQQRESQGEKRPVSRALSRRDLLTSARLQAKEQALATGREMLRDRIRESYPLREAWLSRLPRLPALPQEQSDDRILEGAGILTAHEVLDACNGCGHCQRACPRGAWQLATTTDFLTLTHDAPRCTDCGRCRQQCPQEGIVSTPLTWQYVQGPVELQRWGYASCTKCRRRLSEGRLDRGLCTACRKQENLKKNMPGRGLGSGSGYHVINGGGSS